MAAKVPGTEGYDSISDQFIEATLSIDFDELHRDFLPFIPQNSGKVLDLGAIKNPAAGTGYFLIQFQ